MNKKKIDLNFYPRSLFNIVSKSLGSEFDRLYSRFQTGYVNVFYQHHNIINSNKHIADPESFPMSAKEIKSNFSDPRTFNAVNHKEYWLKQKKTRHGIINNQYSISRKQVDGAIYCKPTNWMIKTVTCSIGGTRKPAQSNGYKLSPKINEIVDMWVSDAGEVNQDDTTSFGLVNRNGSSVTEVEEQVGGAIFREISNTKSSLNINARVQINILALKHHKEQLELIINRLDELDVDVLHTNSIEYNRLSKELTETNAKRDGEPPWATGGVKVKHTSALALQSLLHKDLNKEGVLGRINTIKRILLTAREENSHSIPVFYEEVRTGRYTAKHAVLQGYRKSVRYAALCGSYEYDLEAAHQNILLQLLEKEGIEFKEMEVFREYISNKNTIRNKLANELNTTIDIVKSIIQALTYGAQLSTNSRRAIYKECSGNELLLNRVVSHPWLKQYSSAFKQSCEALIGDSSTLKNSVGIVREFKTQPPALAHILQGYERLILDAIIKHSNRDDIALLVHDCVVFYNKQSRDKLSAIVEEETGFKLEFSEEKY